MASLSTIIAGRNLRTISRNMSFSLTVQASDIRTFGPEMSVFLAISTIILWAICACMITNHPAVGAGARFVKDHGRVLG
jgi:predicted membrane protein